MKTRAPPLAALPGYRPLFGFRAVPEAKANDLRVVLTSHNPARRDGLPPATTGVGLVDLSLIKLWERECRRHPNAYVRIWSLDAHLASYERQPTGSLT